MKNLLILTLIVFALKLNAQLGINSTGAAPDTKAMLDINSTSKGFLWPRMTLAQRNAISLAPGVTPEGLTIFDTDTKNLWIYKNSGWRPYLQSPWDVNGNSIFNTNTESVLIGTGAPIPGLPNKLLVVATTTDAIRAFSDVGCTVCATNSIGSAVAGNATSTGYGGYFTSTSGHALITGNGNVGIGTFSPTQKLDIDGQIRIRGGSPAVGKVLTSTADGTANWQVANDHNHIGQTWTHSALNGLTITNFASADFNVAISGNANTALRSKGIVGSSTSTTGVGVYGINSSGGGSFFSPADNSGVSGVAGNGIGVFGAGYSGRGIWGLSNSAEGVYGNSVLGNSVYGAKTASQTTGSAGVFEVLNVANTSSALVARSENTALEIDGAIKVVNTSINKPVFIHVTNAGNISGSTTQITYNNPLVTDLLIVTPNYTAGPVYNAHPFGVWFNGGVWRIFNQDLAAMPIGTAFNVMVIKQ